MGSQPMHNNILERWPLFSTEHLFIEHKSEMGSNKNDGLIQDSEYEDIFET